MKDKNPHLRNSQSSKTRARKQRSIEKIHVTLIREKLRVSDLGKKSSKVHSQYKNHNRDNGDGDVENYQNEQDTKRDLAKKLNKFTQKM